MKNTDLIRFQRRRKLIRTVFGVFSLSGILFAFQACYGTPQDFGMDVHIEGKISSSAGKSGLPGIKVVISESGQYTQSSADGTFSMYCERMPSYKLLVSDVDGTLNGSYQGLDTTLLLPDNSDNLIVNIELQ